MDRKGQVQLSWSATITLEFDDNKKLVTVSYDLAARPRVLSAIPFLEAALRSEDYETKSQAMEALWQLPEHSTQIYSTVVDVSKNDENKHIRTKARVLGDKIKAYLDAQNNSTLDLQTPCVNFEG